MIDPMYKLRSLCAEQKADLTDHLAGGGAKDFSEYCKTVGAIQALSMVLGEIEALEKKAVEE